MDNLFEHMVNISKAHAYDIIVDKCKEQEKRIAELEHKLEMTKIQLNGAEQRLEAYKQFVNEVRPKEAKVFELSPIEKEIEEELTRQEFNRQIKNIDDIKNVL